MSEKENRTRLTVIGAGPGGYGAAFLASDLGMDVTLIDPEPNPGGVCLYRGCIPTKTLLHLAKIIRETEKVREWGVGFSRPEIDIDKIRQWKDNVVQKLTGGLGYLCKQRKITTIRGKARFLDPHTVEIHKMDGSFDKLSFDYAILATGAHPAALPDISFDYSRILDSSKALELESIPESLLIVGGGYIGLELGTFYAALGTKVSIVEMMPNLLPGADQDLVRVFSRTAEKLFESIMLNTMVSGIVREKNGVKVEFKKQDGTTEEGFYEKILVTIGRKPNSSGLGLENTNVGIDKRGFVKVNDQRCTKEPSIYAVGDVIGGPLLAHKATREGRVAVEAIAGHKVKFTPRAIPAVLFTDPEIARCGLTETEAREKNLKVKILRFPWAASGRAATMGQTDGLTKFIVDFDTEKILGVGIVGSGAGELISEGALAVESGALISDVAATIHPHPTLSETLMEAAEAFYGQSTHIYHPIRK